MTNITTETDPFLDWCDSNHNKLKEISKDGHQYFVLKQDEGLIFYTADHDKLYDYLTWLDSWCYVKDIFVANTEIYV